MQNGLIKNAVKNGMIRAVNAFGISSKYIGTPKRSCNTLEWIERNGDKKNAFFREIHPGKRVTEAPPVSLEEHIHKIYTDEYEREQPQAFVAGIPGGRTWGKSGIIVTPDDTLLKDISREFGKYGGVFDKDLSVFQQLKLSGVRHIRGRVAVVASAGSNNYHHWLYDTLPRIHLIKLAGLFDSIDYFVLDHDDLKFQTESLASLGIDKSRIIRPKDAWSFHLQADELIVTSLPSRLGTVSDWVVRFLRATFLTGQEGKEKINIYLSRKNAPTRKLLNEEEISSLLGSYGFRPFFPEDHSIAETAACFSRAGAIAGVHGSGFANLSFCSPGTKVIDILAPKHLDPYYWILSNHTESRYAYIFGKGERLPEHTDLVRNKIDENIYLDAHELSLILGKLNIRYE